MNKRLLTIVGFICLVLSACTTNSQSTVAPVENVIFATAISVTDIPVQTEIIEPHLFIEPALPDFFSSSTMDNADIFITRFKGEANVFMQLVPKEESQFYWFYALAAPFKTISNNVNSSELLSLWSGDLSSTTINFPILLSQSTKDSLSLLFGEPSPQTIRVVSDEYLSSPKENENNWAIIPFDQLAPKWKIISIDDVSILDKEIEPNSYFLMLPIGFSGDSAALNKVNEYINSRDPSFPLSNREISSIATIIMTGTTALTRDTGLLMDENGVDYPATDLLEWFQSADLLHISHEISFMPDCDLADRLKFCSKSEYIELLDHIGADVIELTGNHLLDYGEAPFLYSLDLYDEFEMQTFGGGSNSTLAKEPLLLEVNGNRLAFIGCNNVGPESVWATDFSGGANRCDREWISREIIELSSQGYNVIVTFQDLESCDVQPSPIQKGNFIFAATAGAVIVSGSQAHCPQAMEFIGDSFVHYGLGNLFFDQMDSWQSQEFIDRYTFYKGKLISVELLSAKLEEGGKPRPMTDLERLNFLFRIFNSEL